MRSNMGFYNFPNNNMGNINFMNLKTNQNMNSYMLKNNLMQMKFKANNNFYIYMNKYIN